MLKSKSINLTDYKGIIALILITLLPCGVWAKEDNGLPDKVIVGVIDLPPFAIKTAAGQWEGLGIDLWRAAANEMGSNSTSANSMAWKRLRRPLKIKRLTSSPWRPCLRFLSV